ncbi:UNVERIFIED_CONTAM: hypothetical protein PYX00_008115 [Menopon gallinae]|uniref:Uncharacterized protein n=1 Tax=Menopon gallinae TaxID=328185 RepID=A0AAW2HLZ7_9NEOP
MEEKITEDASTKIAVKEVGENNVENDVVMKEVKSGDAPTENQGEEMVSDEPPKEDATRHIDEYESKAVNDNQIITESNAGTNDSVAVAETNANDVAGSDKHESEETVGDASDAEHNGGTQTKNYKHVILEDWGFDVPQGPAAETSAENINNNNNNNDNNVNNNNNNDISNSSEYNNANHESVTDGKESVENNRANHSEASNEVDERKPIDESNEIEQRLEELDRKPNYVENDLIKPVLDKKKNPLKYSNLIVSNQDIVEILDSSRERVCRPIIPAAKDLFLSIELTKHLNQKLSRALPGKKNEDAKSNDSSKKVLPDYHSKLVKTVTQAEGLSPGAQKDDANKPANPVKTENDQSKKGKRKSVKKSINLGDEMERTIALRQLRDEFPSTRRRSHTTKKVNHIPFLASTVLEKALTSVNTPNRTVGQRRRPCYLPAKEENAQKEETADEQKDLNISDLSNSSNPVVRTYCIKRKSTDSESEVRSALQTFLSASKELQEEDGENVESKPKKQKTVQEGEKTTKSTPKKGKDAGKKRNLELEKLLGDEGAVRMLYETQHQDGTKPTGKKSRMKSPSGLKKDLMLKTKLVKSAVLRLSGASSDGVSLRGKRRSLKSDSEPPPEQDSLFATSTPNVILYKPKKKQRAEASRILYRHSSSESFESLDGLRRTSVEGDVANSTNHDGAAAVNSDLFDEKEPAAAEEPDSGSSKKTKIPKKTKIISGKRVKKLKTRKERQESKIMNDRRSRESLDGSNTKLDLSHVPVRKSNRPRVVSKKYSIWASTSMDSLSVESLGLKKPKKASQEFAKKLNYKELRILQHGSLVQIILTPSSTVLKNSLNEQVLTELKEAFDFLAQQESCSVILLTSHGTTFCQGIDLNYVLSVEEDDRKQTFENLLNCLKQFVLCLANFKKPVIAGVHAGAVGFGVTLLTYCDIVLSSDRASFYTPYARLGQLSEGAATVTFPRIHKNLVAELLFRSKKLTATEALKIGLVSQVIPEERFDEEVMLISRRMASQSAQAMQSMKSLLNSNEYEKIAETLEEESQIILEHWCSNDCVNNIIKFLNSGEVQFRQLDVT